MLALLTLLACSGGSSETDATVPTSLSTTPEPGTLALSFQISSMWLDPLANAGEEPKGPFSGAIYRNEDVDALGPFEGAVALEDVSLPLVDMSPDGGPTEVLYTTGPLDYDIVVILGFLDTDGNAGTGDPDSGDPVTLVGENKFQMVPGEETAATVTFGLLYP